MTQRLKQIDNHEALFLLQNCFSMPKLNYFLRTAPCFQEGKILENYDKIICESLTEILNIQLSESAWEQASLPIAKGGLGLRPALHVALAGFLSSFSASDKLIKDLLTHNSTQQT